MDTHAAELQQFSPGLVSGLFHSADYARSCIEAASFGAVPGVEEAVAARLQRGARLREPGAPRVHLVLLEAALRWVPAGGGTDATVATLRNLVEAATHCSHITLGVIPSGTPMPVLPQGSFMIVNWRDPDAPSIVLAETPAAEITFTDDQEVTDFRTAWQRVTAVAGGPEESVAFIAELAAHLHAGTTL